MMKIKHITTILLATLLFCGGFLVSGVAQQSSDSECSDIDISVRCILINAEETLSLIDDPFDYATSAVELAIAQDANGNKNKTWQLFDQAIEHASKIEDKARKETAMSDIALALSKVKANEQAMGVIETINSFALDIEDPVKMQDLKGKAITATAVHGDAAMAVALAYELPVGNFTLDSFKARTLREVASQTAKKGDFKTAVDQLSKITMGLPYYSSMAHSDIATTAAKMDEIGLIPEVLENATSIARGQDDGYFIAGALRDIGVAYVNYGDDHLAGQYFEEALEGARNANTFQEKARSMSRIATRMADVGITSSSLEILNEALSLARQEESELFRNFSLYEISGSAAFCGQFEMTRTLLEEIPDIPFSSTSSLLNASKRDLAWGLAKYGDFSGAIAAANSIETRRERVQTLSRIARIIIDPKMVAIARYL